MKLSANWYVKKEDVHAYQRLVGLDETEILPLSYLPTAYQRFEHIPWLEGAAIFHVEQQCICHELLMANKHYDCTLTLLNKKQTSKGHWIYEQKLQCFEENRLLATQYITLFQRGAVT